MPKQKSGCTKKLILIGLSSTILIAVILALLFKSLVSIDPPKINETIKPVQKVVMVDSNTFYVGNNWLKKNKYGLWELYVEGYPYQRGLYSGMLTKNLLEKQETAFVNQINTMIPNNFYLFFLKILVAWFNRDLDKYVPLEYQKEIYGISKSSPHKFDYIAPTYQRLLNYHAAHDIGHALMGMNFVGCTSFSAWDNYTIDSTIIVGRNFDFYVGDEFAKEKIIEFVNPSNGYKFMMVTWAGMIGVVSGMNEKGLTITLNAAKSDYPTSAATPISLVAREILQYAKNIDEAFEIAKKRKTFVSESIMIGSKSDNKTIVIEKSPNNIGLYETDSSEIICTNHFQSSTFKDTPLNLQNIEESASMYRDKRVKQLLLQKPKLNINRASEILRDVKGLNGRNIGLGNEKTINQLIAHHSIIFDPTRLIVWISTSPYQLGSFVAYDLKKIFNNSPKENLYEVLRTDSLTIPPDKFLYSKEYREFTIFRKLNHKIQDIINEGKDSSISQNQIDTFINSDTEFYKVYRTLGDYFSYKGNSKEAIRYYKIALGKEIATLNERNAIASKISQLQENE